MLYPPKIDAQSSPIFEISGVNQKSNSRENVSLFFQCASHFGVPGTFEPILPPAVVKTAGELARMAYHHDGDDEMREATCARTKTSKVPT